MNKLRFAVISQNMYTSRSFSFGFSNLFTLLLMLTLSGTLSAQRPELRFGEDNKFKIVQFTDIHYITGTEGSDSSLSLMHHVLEAEQPDLVLFTGDIITCSPQKPAWDDVLDILIKRNIPYAVVFGNHDDEHDLTRAQIMDYISTKPYCLSERGPETIKGVGNFVLHVKDAQGELAALLYCFDSNAYNKVGDQVGYDWFGIDQIEWYRKTSRQYTESHHGVPYPAIAFFHIPLQEYTLLYDTTKNYVRNAPLFGLRTEKECPGILNTGMFAALVEGKDVMATFVGHDHDNDYIGYLNGICLAYGRFSGSNNTYTHLEQGARVIELTASSRTFSTWIRTATGIAQSPLSYPASFLPFRNPALGIEKRVEDILSRLTPQEKVAQMMHDAPGIERLGIPPYNWWNEALHGVARAGQATVFPQAIALAATFDDDALLTTFTIVSDEARAKYHHALRNDDHSWYKGLTFWTPNINIFRDPRWGRGMETYGEDPYLTRRMGLSVVRGLQGDDPRYFKTHACAKHYAVHSGPEWNRHEFDVAVSPRDLRTTYLPAFQALVTEGNVQEVMCAYNRLDGQPCCANGRLLIDILRHEWQYDRILLSDCGAIDDFWRKGRHGSHPDSVIASAAALRSGTDLECGNSYRALDAALREGLISEATLDSSLRRLFRARFQLGMFDPDSLVPYADYPIDLIENPRYVKHAAEMARKSIVLLSNRNNTLPLRKTLRRIAVIGPNANDSTMLWGNYNGFPSHTVTILEGIRRKLPDAIVDYHPGCPHVDTDNDSINAGEALRIAGEADVILFVGGLSPSLEGEEMPVNASGFRGGDRTTIDVPQPQRQLFRQLRSLGTPLVYILCTGSALAIDYEAEAADAVLNAWYGGQQAGTAVADVLFGDYNPAGRLPVTFYRSTAQLPPYEDYTMTGRTYRYLDTPPLYPFGYGLSYTTFAYTAPRLSRSAAPHAADANFAVTDTLLLTFTVINTGKVAGDEVPQLYLQYPDHPEEPRLALKDFRRLHLKAGQSADVTFRLAPSTFQTFDDHTQRLLTQPGRYTLLISSSSAQHHLTVPFRIQ
jgi:beta-glucosidase